MFNEFKEFYRDAKQFRDILEKEEDYEVNRAFLKAHFPILNRLIICQGQENIVTEGPNLIVANYAGMNSFIGLIREFDRPLYSAAPKVLFSEEATLKNVQKKFEYFGAKAGHKAYGWLEHTVDRYAKLISERMNSFEMIPVDLDYDGDNAKKIGSQKQAMNTIKDYLKTDKAVVLFQGRKNYMSQIVGKSRSNKEKSQHHNNLNKFSNAAAKIAWEMHLEDLTKPIEERIPLSLTEVACYNKHPWNPLSTTLISIGPRKYMSIFIESEHPDIKHVIPDFTDSIEEDIAEMLVQMGIPRDKKR